MSGEEKLPEFQSPADEITYWKKKAEEWKFLADSSKEELDEFQVGENYLISRLNNLLFG